MSHEIARTKAYYEKYGKRWSERHTNPFHHERQFRMFVDLLPKSGSVLDIGCANGAHVPLFLGIGRYRKYTGIDISKSLLAIAEKRYPQLTFLHGNIADAATLPKKKFDGFFAAAVLMHVPFPLWDTMFKNIEHMAKPHAIAYALLPTEHPNTAHSPDDTRHFTILTPHEQTAYFKKRDWTILHKGIIDGTTKKGVWRWYLLKLPA